MKLYLCQPITTSDDEEEEEVSEEEQQEDSIEDEDVEDTAASNEEEDIQSDSENDPEDKVVSASKEKAANKSIVDLKTSLKTNGKPNKSNESVHTSDASFSSDAETSLKSVNGVLDIKKETQQDQEKKTKITVSKLPNNIKSTTTTSSQPARLKNLNTEMMVMTAIRSLNERGGSSAIAIKKYIMNNYPHLDDSRTLILVKKFIKKGLTGGKLIQAKGTGLGGSFKVSAETNRLDAQKERQNRKKLMKSTTKEKDTSAGKVDKIPKASAKATKKKVENGEKKAETAKKTAQTKTSKTIIKVGEGAETAKRVPQLSAAAKKVVKLTDTKQPKKPTPKDTKPSTIANAKPKEKSKMVKPIKATKDNSTNSTNGTAAKQKKTSPAISASTLASPAKAVQKATASAAMLKNKLAAKGKEIPAVMAEIGAGDADTVKPNKKPAGRKAKTK